MISSTFGPISLVVIQGTSFCNLDCDYCYLPNRHLKNQLSLDIIEPIFKNIFSSPFVGNGFTVCWHAGEPLTLPIDFYDTAIKSINQVNHNEYQVRQSVQTNGTLINQAWCDLFKNYHIDVGVSLDGPAFIHDAHRKTRKATGTHAGTMRGISFLQKNNINFYVIAVISEQCLDYPDEIFNFFLENNITDVGFNIEEIEGVNQTSSLNNSKVEAKYRDFIRRFWELTVKSNGVFKLREFERICSFIYTGQRITKSGLLTPFVMLNIDNQGNFSTFDPELLSVKTNVYGDFILGNLLEESLESVCYTEKFQKIYQDINAGVQLCADTCQYFGICGGGSGSNKFWENGTFRSAETMACRYYEQIIAEIILEHWENSL